MPKIKMLLATAVACCCLAAPAWGLSTLPPEDPLLPSEQLPEGLQLAFSQDSPRWQPEGVLPSGMPRSFLEVARIEGGQTAPAKTVAAAQSPAPSAGAAEAEAASALLGRSDLNASVPLADPSFEFKSGPALPPQNPAWVDNKSQPNTARAEREGGLGLAVSAGALAVDPPGRPTAGRAAGQDVVDNMPRIQSGGPLFGADGRIQEDDSHGGFLTLRWNPAPALGLTLGGGYQRSQTAVGGDASSWQVANGPTPSMSMRDNNTGVSTASRYNRWAAYLAVPYQLSDKLGLQPELSYYYTDMPDLGAVAGNEWVMGLQFTFGF